VKEDPNEVEEGHDFTENLNPDSLQVMDDCKIEPSVRDAKPGTKYQFERLGYYCVDRDSRDSADKLVFNRTIGLRDTWAKIEKRATTGA
jgi:glutaminyl-tRNA synthetase